MGPLLALIVMDGGASAGPMLGPFICQADFLLAGWRWAGGLDLDLLGLGLRPGTRAMGGAGGEA